MNGYLSKAYENSWTNDQRMGPLFASFPQKDVNSLVYENRLAFWKHLILQTFQANPLLFNSKNIIILTTDNLQTIFKRKNVTPKGIQTVLKHLVDGGELIGVDAFEGGGGWGRWISQGFVQTSRLLFGKGEGGEVLGDYIVMQSLEAFTDVILTYFYTHKSVHFTDNLFYFDDLVDLFNESIEEVSQKFIDPSSSTTSSKTTTTRIKFSNLDQKVLISNLIKNDHMIESFDPDTKKMVFKLKWKPEKSKSTLKSSSSSTQIIIDPICQTDFGVLVLKESLKSLTSQTIEIQTSIDNILQECKQSIKQNTPQKSKYLLKKKSTLQKILDSRFKSLLQIDQILTTLQTSATQLELLQTFKTGSETLQAFLKENNLSLERVDEVMVELESVLADHKEIDDAIREVAVVDVGDEEELERQLEALVLLEEEGKVLEMPDGKNQGILEMPDGKNQGILEMPDGKIVGLEMPDVPGEKIMEFLDVHGDMEKKSGSMNNKRVLIEEI